LTSSIPDLGLDGLGIDLNRTSGELDTDGGLGVEVEFVASEAREQIGLADARVTDEDDYRVKMSVVLSKGGLGDMRLPAGGDQDTSQHGKERVEMRFKNYL
jgi:hypothetical protein